MFAVHCSRSVLATAIQIISFFAVNTNAFRLPLVKLAFHTSQSYFSRETHLFGSRRDFLECAPISVVALTIATTTSFAWIPSAAASGGATAGGAYLLSVRIRHSPFCDV
jgi:hypothetical protein